MHVLKARN